MSKIPENLSQLEKKVNQLIALMTNQKRSLIALSTENQNLIAENASLRNELEIIHKSDELNNDVAFFKGSENKTSNKKVQLNQLIQKVDQCVEDFSKIMYQTVA
ncbi:MAG: hypothetical protein OXE77_04145 [Flavobacteriaceae bacterium]|nr:hypothetical protein [Flavobacteriaceae bacterium]MCY4266539.1 hypothetical protein [Flavobacteriaceae bacterium]MCY4299839.1 hypothetical protein [Flavobacteriaceae bacterium]